MGLRIKGATLSHLGQGARQVDARTDVTQARQQAAEEVRAHLVCLRGQGLFLSSDDSRLLVQWLEAGVDVPRILRALERAAEARRAKRSKVPLRLVHAKRHLDKPTRGVFAVERPHAGRDGPLFPVVRALAIRDDGDSRAREELEAVLKMAGGASAEDLFRTAAAAARAFLEARWRELARPQREALKASAREELGDLVHVVDLETLEALVEEGARDRLRAGYPALSAASLWEAAEAGATDGA
jgi:hypothetical protein